jgi:hypothetical protein
VILKNLKFKKP